MVPSAHERAWPARVLLDQLHGPGADFERHQPALIIGRKSSGPRGSGFGIEVTPTVRD